MCNKALDILRNHLHTLVWLHTFNLIWLDMIDWINPLWMTYLIPEFPKGEYK